MIKSLSILGSTGSIGTQTLDVARKLNIKVNALSAYSSIELLEEQIREFRPALAVVFDADRAEELKIKIADTSTKVLSGMSGLHELCHDDSELIVNAIVGMVGLEPTLEAIKAKKDIAFANKETLVAGGALVMDAVKEYGVKLLPVDSEHSAIFQCLQAAPPDKKLKKILLTASGGPFFGRTADELRDVTVEQALAHPNWSMGAKITIDSATMMNKGLEIIEAAWLFDTDPDDIEVVVHRESIIHSMVEFTDNSVLAQLGLPDMRIPIQYAITYPDRVPSLVPEIDWKTLSQMTFYSADDETFRCLAACKRAMKKGGLYPAVANGANEVANRLFRDGKISFLQIGELVSAAVDELNVGKASDLDDVLAADRLAREFVYQNI
ncbi:1-deoxy-D-xylulose-5-phosphate reductoisomerase [Ruminococcus difficilis]|uniref:1-deoxy-D-xylulose 5-phosphate reductoisomerase n=1 Tax=Ruminococcus difficilis TaxID=2763069 RepID=A0A934WPF2_9FIRM|nr:1-deoxy-D-xylulose-5-phosphate reductoisomerase [Ruminococcus difficilis]MBK6087816.1 1-deoxy-D-xylulose-5-phosphate reductoisomerase [Ruminococcus difficilis]